MQSFRRSRLFPFYSLVQLQIRSCWWFKSQDFALCKPEFGEENKSLISRWENWWGNLCVFVVCHLRPEFFLVATNKARETLSLSRNGVTTLCNCDIPLTVITRLDSRGEYLDIALKATDRALRRNHAFPRHSRFLPILYLSHLISGHLSRNRALVRLFMRKVILR